LIRGETFGKSLITELWNLFGQLVSTFDTSQADSSLTMISVLVS